MAKFQKAERLRDKLALFNFPPFDKGILNFGDLSAPNKIYYLIAATWKVYLAIK